MKGCIVDFSNRHSVSYGLGSLQLDKYECEKGDESDEAHLDKVNNISIIERVSLLSLQFSLLSSLLRLDRRSSETHSAPFIPKCARKASATTI